MRSIVKDRCDLGPISALLEVDSRDSFADSCAAVEGKLKHRGNKNPVKNRKYSAKAAVLAAWFSDPGLLPKLPPTRKVA